MQQKEFFIPEQGNRSEQKCFLQLISYGSKQTSSLPYHVSEGSVFELYCYSYTCLPHIFCYVYVIDCIGLISALSIYVVLKLVKKKIKKIKISYQK